MKLAVLSVAVLWVRVSGAWAQTVALSGLLGGRRHTLRVGEAPAGVGSGGRLKWSWIKDTETLV